MARAKPVAYPNLLDKLNEVVSAHAAIHEAVANHATAHVAKLEDKRKQRHVANMAKKLIEGDGKP